MSHGDVLHVLLGSVYALRVTSQDLGVECSAANLPELKKKKRNDFLNRVESS
jgi:hypothetical protein